MPRPAITPEKREEMRGEIRAAVLRIARDRKIAPNDMRGWQGITVRDIAEEAGISTGNFYKYFENRSDLAQTLWAEPVNRLRADMQAAFEAAASPADKVRSQLEHYADFAIRNHGLFRSVFLLVRPAEDAVPQSAAVKDETLYRNLCIAFREGQAAGDFRDFDPDTMAQLFWASIHGSLALPINLDRYDFDPPAMLSAKMIDALMELVTRPE